MGWGVSMGVRFLEKWSHIRIRDFPYYATFRENGAKLACADKLGVFLSLTLCKKASFEYLAFIK